MIDAVATATDCSGLSRIEALVHDAYFRRDQISSVADGEFSIPVRHESGSEYVLVFRSVVGFTVIEDADVGEYDIHRLTCTSDNQIALEGNVPIKLVIDVQRVDVVLRQSFG